MNVIQTVLPGVLIIEPRIINDNRGFFIETFRQENYRDIGIAEVFVQDNHSRSARGVLRGLHFQTRFAQGKLVRVSAGEVFDVAVDINPASATFGKHVAAILDDKSHRQMYIPPGYAHGFCVISDIADFQYKCTEYYRPDYDAGVLWNDSDIGIAWPLPAPLLSDKDRQLPRLRELT